MENMYNIIDALFYPFIQRQGFVQDAEVATRKVSLPINLYEEEDGTNIVELAIPGKTKEDVTVSAEVKDGVNYLVIDVKEKELTEEEKAAAGKRKVFEKLIKTTQHCSLRVPSNLDIDNLKPHVENGLLRITIPVAEAAKPKVFTID